MSYLVSLHYCGGSSGEAIEAVKLVHVGTKDEAKRISKKVHAHPNSRNGNELWARVIEIPEIQSEAGAEETMFQSSYLEEEED